MATECESTDKQFGEWRQVPGIDASILLVSSEGWVRVRTTSKGGIPLLGPPRRGSFSDGTKTFRVGVGGSTFLVHRLIAIAFLGPAPSSSHTVDHLNQDSSDNRVSNLRWATKSQQSLNRGKREVQRTANRVVLIAPNGESQTYSSALAAAKAIGANTGNICNSAKYGWRVNGYIAKYDIDEDQSALTVDGEIEQWKAAPGNANLMVSTMGRIQFRHYSGALGFRKTPKPSKRLAGYCFVRVGRSDMLVHRLVMETFVGPPPPNASSVDHINHIRHDNRLANLRYSSCTEQRSNRIKIKVTLQDLPIAPQNIDLAAKKTHYRRVGRDGVWVVRMQGTRRKWHRAKVIFE